MLNTAHPEVLKAHFCPQWHENDLDAAVFGA